MRRRSARTFLTTAAALAVSIAAALAGPGVTAATSAADTTPPTLDAPVKASFVVGSQVPVGQTCADENDVRVYVPARLTWSGSDDSGQVRYTLTEYTGSGGPFDVLEDSEATSFDAVTTNDDQFCGGGSWSVYQWDLTATDPAGNSASRYIYGGRMRLTQENGQGDQADYASAPLIGYGGGWRRSQCACWSEGQVRRTLSRGATATIRPQPYNAYPAYTDQHTVGLVMHKGPNRGRFRILVDGEAVRTIDLYAPVEQPRVVVWRRAFADFGHTIQIRNLATEGRPRIDLDAVLTN